MRLKKFPVKTGSVPLTEVQSPLGLLSLKHKKGSYLKAHLHKPQKRSVSGRLNECFVVLTGKVRVDLYGPDKKYFKHIFLTEGQLLITVNGGHGFRVIEDCEIYEIKHGPYLNDKVFI